MHCDSATHAILRASRAAFDAGTDPIGTMPAVAGSRALELGNCKGCKTTIAAPLERPDWCPWCSEDIDPHTKHSSLVAAGDKAEHDRLIRQGEANVAMSRAMTDRAWCREVLAAGAAAAGRELVTGGER